MGKSLGEQFAEMQQRHQHELVQLMTQSVQAALGEILSRTTPLALPVGKPTKPAKGEKAATPAKVKGKAATTKAKAPRVSTGGRRTGRATLEAAHLIGRFVALNPAVKAAQIADGTSMPVASLQAPLAKALSLGWINKTGERAATRYYPGAVPAELPAEEPAPAVAVPAIEAPAASSPAAPAASSVASPTDASPMPQFAAS